MKVKRKSLVVLAAVIFAVISLTAYATSPKLLSSGDEVLSLENNFDNSFRQDNERCGSSCKEKKDCMSKKECNHKDFDSKKASSKKAKEVEDTSDSKVKDSSVTKKNSTSKSSKKAEKTESDKDGNK